MCKDGCYRKLHSSNTFLSIVTSVGFTSNSIYSLLRKDEMSVCYIESLTLNWQLGGICCLVSHEACLFEWGCSDFAGYCPCSAGPCGGPAEHGRYKLCRRDCLLKTNLLFFNVFIKSDIFKPESRVFVDDNGDVGVHLQN